MFMRIAAVVALTSIAGTAASAQGVEYFRQQGQMTCMGDVMSLCADSIPDESRIIACMRQRHAQLSAGCRQVFDAGVVAQKRARTRRSTLQD